MSSSHKIKTLGLETHCSPQSQYYSEDDGGDDHGGDGGGDGGDDNDDDGDDGGGDGEGNITVILRL